VQRTSRTGVSYYVLTNPIVPLIRAEDDPLVREQYNRALQNYNRTRPNNDEAANGQERAALSNEEPAASAKAKVSGTRKSKRLIASCHAKDDNEKRKRS